MLHAKNFEDQLKPIVDRYDLLAGSRHSEADVETKLIEPFFQLLGWNADDFSKRPHVHRRGDEGGIADYEFKLDGYTVFYLEAKKLTIDLNQKHAKQAISYALSTRVPFAFLTNFRELIIYCSEEDGAFKKPFRRFALKDYVERRHELENISKDAFRRHTLLNLASDEGRLKERRTMDKVLLDDMMLIRKRIANEIESNYPGRYSSEEKDGIVQRIMDRLIFIRKCEDSQISVEGVSLTEVSNYLEGRVYFKLKEAFAKYDEVFNSGLFRVSDDNDCDTITLSGDLVSELIRRTYTSKDEQYEYWFNIIDADILGQAYEQYLSLILEETKGGKVKLSGGRPHRKEQGIYYTPTYIVDFITRRAFDAYLNNQGQPSEIAVLDPACGSGSFLIRAFDRVLEMLRAKSDIYQKRLDEQGVYGVKTDILKNNLYGVDLDRKAIEITKLNLLLKAAERNRKLPIELDSKILCGNSLVDDVEIAPDTAFKWASRFETQNFDLILANPPYHADLTADEKGFFKRSGSPFADLHSGDSAELFLKRAGDLLKPGGVLGFIVPKSIAFYENWAGIRETLLNSFEITNLADVGIAFSDVNLEELIIVARKRSPKRTAKILVTRFSDLKRPLPNKSILVEREVSASIMRNKNILLFTPLTDEEQSIIEKVDNASVRFSSLIADAFRGVFLTDELKKGLRPGKTKFILKEPWLQRYGVEQVSMIDSGNSIFNPDQNSRIMRKKLIFKVLRGRRLSIHLDSDGSLLTPTNINNVVLKENLPYQHDFVLGLLNSRLYSFYVQKSLFSDSTESARHLDKPYVSMLPMPKSSGDVESNVSQLANEQLKLQSRIFAFGDKHTPQRKDLEVELRKNDEKINSAVFDLYGLGEEERKLVNKWDGKENPSG